MSTTTGRFGLRSTAATLWRLRAADPTVTLAALGAVALTGATPAAPYVAASLRNPRRTAIVDDHGELTYRELDDRTAAYAAALESWGLGESTRVGILCRNHRGFVEANITVARLGATPVYLNTGFAGPQTIDVVRRESLDLVVHDLEFSELLTDADVALLPADPAERGWTFPTLERAGSPGRRPNRRRTAPTVLLTSGTTGTPKGALRDLGDTSPAAGLGTISAIPVGHGDTFVIPAPLFHAWGLSQHLVAAMVGGTVVLRDRFDPEVVLADIRRHRAEVLIAVPVMLQRILELAPGGDTIARESLRVVATSGSALPAGLATRWMDGFGDTLYNLYGSTEVGQVTIAGPADLRADPATSGRPPAGTSLRILDDDGQPVADGTLGRIAVGGGTHFSGYTSGDSKEVVDGYMVTGDMGWIDADGCLRVAGRDDDMIVSGGENVYPREVEDLLVGMDGVTDAAVVGVDDEAYGQALHAFVVRRPDAPIDANAVKAHVRDHLARFKVPRRVRFVDDLPRSPTGKILRRELPTD